MMRVRLAIYLRVRGVGGVNGASAADFQSDGIPAVVRPPASSFCANRGALASFRNIPGPYFSNHQTLGIQPINIQSVSIYTDSLIGKLGGGADLLG